MSVCDTPESSFTDLSSTRAGRSVLVVDHDPIQLKLAQAHLEAKGLIVRIATGASAALVSARADRPDAIISNVRLGHLDGFTLCSLLRSEPQLDGVPVVLVADGPEDAQDRRLATAAGAHALIERSSNAAREVDAIVDLLAGGGDCVATGSLDPYILRMAGQLGQLLTRSHTIAARYKSLLNSAHDAITVLTPDGIILEVNRGCEQLLQMPRERMVGHHIREFAAPGHEDSNVAEYRGALDAGTGRMPAIPIARADGSCVHVEWSTKAARVGTESVVIAVGRDVTDSVEARRNLAVSEEKYRTLIESLPDVVWSARLDGAITFISAAVERVCGFTADEVRRASPSFWFDRIHPEDVDRVRQAYTHIAKTDYAAEYRWQHKDGHWIWIRSHASSRIGPDGIERAEGTFADITELKRAEEHVRQSQKMEAIGQLTGGIAHDFNNMLAVIIGNGEFLHQSLTESDIRRADADAILEAARRAAGLTRQLLAFSRRQVLEPRVLDLNEIVRGLEKMLRRIIGEDIEFASALTDGLHPVRADAGQIEQVIMNLVVNARDAMPVGGKLSIETANVLLDAEYCSTHPGSARGEYVMLAVSDTGCGMDAETKRRLFEPFFTTKEQGKGTGLGLSTCYGIVKQSEGCIWVYSEPGQGTAFKVYLPVAPAEAGGTSIDTAAQTALARGKETILVIEDEAQVRAMVRRILTSRSYEVLEACDGEEAIAIAADHTGMIDLVLSDVVIPGLSGPEIVQEVERHRGRTPALFMSGYTDHAVLRDRILSAGANFIQKPFSPAVLAKKVRDVLDAPQGARL
jgi:two-component system cell cycle sensor histidine kinase/response regulator CckA